eukprot:328772_1
MCPFHCFYSGLCLDESKACDSSRDCNDYNEEIACCIIIDVDTEKYAYLNGKYTFFQYDTTYNGRIYFGDSGLYIHPVITYWQSHNIYEFDYLISYDYNEKQYTSAYCVVYWDDYPRAQYFVFRIELCSKWYVGDAQSGQFVETNVSWEYCLDETTSNAPTNTPLSISLRPTKSPNILGYNVSDDMEVPPEWYRKTESITFYVDSNGTDISHCGTETFPCGTISYGVIYAQRTANRISSIEQVIIIVRGQNEQIIEDKNELNNVNPCFALVTLNVIDNKLAFNQITFDFDTSYVTSMKDWWPTMFNRKLCDYQTGQSLAKPTIFEVSGAGNMQHSVMDFTVIINNCIIDNWVINENSMPYLMVGTGVIGGNINVKYILNYLTIVNIKVDYSPTPLIKASEIEIHNLQFINNTINSGVIISTNFNPDILTDIAKKNQLIMNSCVIKNFRCLGTSSFLDIAQTPNAAELNVRIQNNTLENIDGYNSYIFNFFGDIKSHSVIMENNSFFNMKSNILQAVGMNAGTFLIQNTYISTSMLLKQYQQDSLSLFNLIDSQVNISNINIQYIISKQLLSHCSPFVFVNKKCLFMDGLLITNATKLEKIADINVNFTQSIVWDCDSPIGLINVNDKSDITKVNIDSMRVTTDVDEFSLNSAKNELFELYDANLSTCSIERDAVTSIHYFLDPKETLTNTFGFVTVDGGYVSLSNIDLHGDGIANIFVVQKGNNGKDTVQISNFNMHPQQLDQYGLNMNWFTIHDGDGTFIIDNCNLTSISEQAFNFSGGSNYIHNCSLQNMSFAITATNNVDILEIIDSIFIRIGRLFRYAIIEFEWMINMRSDNQVGTTSPLTIAAKNVLIMNCIFDTYDTAGIILFSSAWPSLYNNEFSKSNVIFIKNTVKSNYSDFFYDPLLFPYQAKGLINIFGNEQVYNIRNSIVASNSIGGKSLYHQNTTGFSCFGGNVFIASTIIDIDSGQIDSCFRSNIKEIIKKNEDKFCCYESFQKNRNISLLFDHDDTNMGNWIATNSTQPLIRTNKQAHEIAIVLDNITLYTDFGDEDISLNYSFFELTGINAAYFFTDIAFNDYNELYLPMDYNSQRCNISCFDIYQQDYNRIYVSQYYTVCADKFVNTDLHHHMLISTDKASYINHTTPFYINFKYDKMYRVGSELNITFFVTDRFGNIIQDYCAPILFEFMNKDLDFENVTIANVSGYVLLKLPVSNDKAYQNITIFVRANHGDLIVGNGQLDIMITPLPLGWVILWEYLLFLLIVPFIVVGIILYCRQKKRKEKKEYMNAYIVDRSLVLIIGIAQFDDITKHLGGVRRNVNGLIELWRDKYNYDVYICNYNTLHSTKRQVVKFVDDHVAKLDQAHYKCIIVHILSHGVDDSFGTSEGKMIKLNFIRHEINSICEELQQKKLIKLIFHHACRGHSDWHFEGITSKSVEENTKYEMRTTLNMNGSIDNKTYSNIAYDANCMTIFGNIEGRAMSDYGYFTDCIRESFGKNMNKLLKLSFSALITEIGRELEKRTNHAELCNINGTLRYQQIRFEKSKYKKLQNDGQTILLETNMEEESDESLSNHNKVDNCIEMVVNNQDDVIALIS